LISITGAYKTTSTEALQVIGGCLPLDLELKMLAIKEKVWLGQETNNKVQEVLEEILETWNNRWVNITKGRWTYEWFPNVKDQYWIPIEMDHFVTQFISGHGDFNGKLHGFKLKDSPLCECGEPETAKHVLFTFPRVHEHRELLKAKITKDGTIWPCELKELVRSRARFEAFRRFARESLINRTDR